MDKFLIEPIGKNSTWYKHLKKHGEGFHHIAFNVEGMKKNIVYLEKLKQLLKPDCYS